MLDAARTANSIAYTEITQYRREILEAALAFAAAGVYVFPCLPADKTPNYSLVPRERGQQRGSWVKNSGGHLKATTDPTLITEWWSLCPDSMIGAYCAKSGIFVIDPDAPKQRCPGKIGEMTPDGRSAWEALKEKHGGHDQTYEVATPGGGLHVYFRADPARPVTNSEGSLGGLGINVRSNGYVILPPSRRGDRKPYVANQPFDREVIAEAPGWLYAALGAKRRVRPKTAPSAAPDASKGSSFATINPGPSFPLTRDNAELLHGALLTIPADDRTLWLRILMALRSIEPDWGDAVNKIAVWWSKRSPKYDDSGFERAWESLVPDKEDGVTIATLFFEARNRGWGSSENNKEDYSKASPRKNGASDDDLALVFIQRHAVELRYVSFSGKWFKWAGARWEPEKILTAFDLARNACRETISNPRGEVSHNGRT